MDFKITLGFSTAPVMKLEALGKISISIWQVKFDLRSLEHLHPAPPTAQNFLNPCHVFAMD
ncbi:c296e3cd-6da4-454f-aefc-4fdab20f4e6c-CDS [Sclerotinia trifoliorum]|uniref:C296e3cd-6da4-454f-aefc-4fdab20f4e6c-CDS n=1 Tax=Sclerotinia trifoliorum TaxID=28548 RepID=A0A8H2VT24_9HELO|nr:c296e3cd-6da4-454f-aefc-4fdab20f4e6c-CDS [Sclerotinia trifoliorum]